MCTSRETRSSFTRSSCATWCGEVALRCFSAGYAVWQLPFVAPCIYSTSLYMGYTQGYCHIKMLRIALRLRIVFSFSLLFSLLPAPLDGATSSSASARLKCRVTSTAADITSLPTRWSYLTGPTRSHLPTILCLHLLTTHHKSLPDIVESFWVSQRVWGKFSQLFSGGRGGATHTSLVFLVWA